MTNGVSPSSAMSNQDHRKRRGRKNVVRKTTSLSNNREHDQEAVLESEPAHYEGAEAPLYDYGDIRTSSTKADVEAGELHGKLKDAMDKIAALELSQANKDRTIESLSGELEATKDKISQLEESDAGKNSLIAELHGQVQHQRNVSNRLTSSLSLKTWEVEIYKDSAKSAHDYAEAKADEQLTNLKREANKEIESARGEAKYARQQMEEEVEYAKEEVQYAVDQAEAAKQAARASKKIADKRGADVFYVAYSNNRPIKTLENVQQDLEGKKADILADYLRVCNSEGRNLVRDMDPELKRKWKASHP